VTEITTFAFMPGSVRKRSIAFSVTNCICNDQRVLKIAETVSGPDTSITLIGRMGGKCCMSSQIPFETKRFRIPVNKGVFFYALYNIRLFIYLLLRRFDVLVSNDLDTLLPNFLISKLKGLPLVYDSHEYFTGVPEILNRPFVKWVWKSIEKKIFPHLRFVMTVSDSIATQYEKDYGVRPVTVRNCSRRPDYLIPYSRKELGVRDDQFLLILQGTGINRDRGGVELIDAIMKVENVSLLIVGSGDMIAELGEKVLRLHVSDKVKFITKVPWEEMMRYTEAADAGLSLDKDTNINYRFSLPNKLFDYLSAGIPVIAGDLPEVSKIVRDYNCGIIISEISADKIAEAIVKLRDKPEFYSELKKNAAEASGILTWEKESVKVRALYESLYK
jgi:glycosyltransferase involved in cell wall biosynthesis